MNHVQIVTRTKAATPSGLGRLTKWSSGCPEATKAKPIYLDVCRSRYPRHVIAQTAFKIGTLGLGKVIYVS